MDNDEAGRSIGRARAASVTARLKAVTDDDASHGCLVRIGSWRFQPGWVPSIVTAALLWMLVMLGFWQLERADEKRDLAARFEARLASPPIALTRDQRLVTRDPSLIDRAVLVRGGYDHRQFLLDNRTHDGIAGYHGISVLERADGLPALLVNRGWLPVGASRSDPPPAPLPRGEITVLGRLVEPASRTFLLGASGHEAPDAAPWPRVVQRIELEPMSRALGIPLAAYVVQLDPGAENGFVRRWTPYLGLPPQRHHGYAFQWFSLAAALAVIYLVVNTHRIRDLPGRSSS